MGSSISIGERRDYKLMFQQASAMAAPVPIIQLEFDGDGLNDLATGAAYSGIVISEFDVEIDAIAVDAYIDTPVLTGSGLDDLSAGGTFSGNADAVFTVVITAEDTPDTFKWKKDSGSFSGDIAITGAAQTLSDGVTITFAATTGHTLNDQWAIPALVFQPDKFKWRQDGGSYTTHVAITGSAQTLDDGVTVTFGAIVGHTLTDNWTITAIPQVKMYWDSAGIQKAAWSDGSVVSMSGAGGATNFASPGTIGATTPGIVHTTSGIFHGATSGTVIVNAPAVAGSQTYTLPTGYPAVNGYALVATTGGVMSWTALSSFDPTAALTLSANGAASTPPLLLSGDWFSGGSSTTTKPQFLVEKAGTTSTAWNTAGTGIGANAPSGFVGYVLDLKVNNSTSFRVNYTGEANSAVGYRTDFYNDITAGAGYSVRLNSTAGVVLPRLTTTEKNAVGGGQLVEGLTVMDTTLHKICVYNGSGWETVTSG